MKLKKLPIFAFSFLLFLASLVLPQNSYAAISCGVNSFVARDQGGSVQICINGLSSVADINSHTLNLYCKGGSRVNNGNFLTMPCIFGQTSWSFPFHATTENVDYWKNQDGTFGSCLQGDGLDPQVHYLDVDINNAAGVTVCETSVQQANATTNACLNGICNTAVGNISTDINGGFLASLVRIGIGLGSGFALLLILYGIFIITTSTGIPDKMKKGQEIITSAISGLVFIILSIFLLNLIGVRILQIPGF